MLWKEKAEKMFFADKKSINNIEAETGISRQTLSAYLKTVSGFQEEKNRRKAENQIKRKEYKKAKNREYRSCQSVTGETMKREHDVAVMILSREKYY